MPCQREQYRDHPRSCGKDSRRYYSSWAASGSPPLVRERLRGVRAESAIRRITPARAGKTRPVRKYKNKKWDHPRSCGKDPSGCRPMPREPGSPPLVRERRFPVYGLIEQIGITPARAGKTTANGECLKKTWDHPRSCGKDTIIAQTTAKGQGSPPLVRERLSPDKDACVSIRITPARAGKTVNVYAQSFGRWDHPRSCGKDSPLSGTASLHAGSPPLVRERRRPHVVV